MKKLITMLSAVILSSCFFKNDTEDIVYKKLEIAALKEDVKILKGIITDMHAGVYLYNTPAELNHVFDSISLSITQAITLRDFYNKVNYIIDRVRCAHTDISLPDNYYDSISNHPVFFPFPVIEIDNRLYVNSDMQKIELGSEILSVNNIKAKDIIKKLKTYYHTDGLSGAAKKIAVDEDFSFNFFLAYGASPDFTIEFISDSSKTIETKTYAGEKLNDLYADIDNSTFYYYPADVDYDLVIKDKLKTAVLTIRTFSFNTDNAMNAYSNFLSNSFRLIKQNGIKNLVIDCRNNNGGYYDATYTLLSYLVNKTMPEFDSCTQRFKKLTFTGFIAEDDTYKITREDTAWHSYTKTVNGYKLLDEKIIRWKPQPEIFKGRIFVIVNAQVISAASTFASILKDKTTALVIGEETGGSNDIHNSSVLKFVLPQSKIKVNVPLRTYYQPVGNKQYGRGVIPDITIPLTVKDLIENNDRQKAYIFDSILVK